MIHNTVILFLLTRKRAFAIFFYWLQNWKHWICGNSRDIWDLTKETDYSCWWWWCHIKIFLVGWADYPCQSFQVNSRLSNLCRWVTLLYVGNIHHVGGFQSRKHACLGQTICCKFCWVWCWSKRRILSWIWKCNTIIFGALYSTWRTGILMDFCMTLTIVIVIWREY